LKNLADLEKSILKYVSKNTPHNLPDVERFTENYIKSLLESDLLRSALALLDSCFGVDLKFNEDSQEWVEEDSLHFILRDFCSVVGLVYKPEYKEVILRSFVQKDIQFYKWLFSEYLGFPVLHVEVIRSGTDSEVSFTDESGGFTDTGIHTDLFVRGYLSLVFFFDKKYKEDIYSGLDGFKDLISLVLPARLFIEFLFV